MSAKPVTRRWAQKSDLGARLRAGGVAWGGHDPILSLRSYGWKALAQTHVQSLTVLPGRHFPQEDCAPQVAALIAEKAARG
jgi:hypothetical protein